jgi:predicted nuclease of predicted toxin-antitoxin system
VIERIRFAADEHVKAALVAELRRNGVDAVTFQEVGRRAESDADQLDWARATARVIITHDDDFLVLAATGRSHAGIAFCRADKYGVGGLLRALLALSEDVSPAEMMNSVRFL